MILLATQALAAAYFFFMATLTNTSNPRSAFIFQTIPLVLGAILSFFTLAQFMGWPV